MEVNERADVRARQEANRRAYPRYYVDASAGLLLMDHGSTLQCKVLDFSLGGCRLRTQEPFIRGIGVCTEVNFRLCGIDFRFRGVTQWTDGRCLIGIRFVDLSERRKMELSEVLSEVAAVYDLQAEEQAKQERRGAEPGSAGPVPPVEAHGAAESTGAGVPNPVREMPPASDAHAMPARQERRRHVRQEVNGTASVFLINGGAVLRGRIVDLSAGGCRIWTESRFLVGIYTRVEVEFCVEGQPFRLGGVIQATHDRSQVGIRFLDMSDRKREQVEQLIEEQREMRQREGLHGREMQENRRLRATG